MGIPNQGTEPDRPGGGLVLDDRRVMLVATFRVATLRLGLDAGRVREALQAQPLTVVPHARPQISGLLNLRGEVVTALDLRIGLGLGTETDDPSLLTNLVVTVGAESVSLLVDEIDDVIEVDAEALEPVPDTVDPQLRSLLDGVLQQPDGLLLILDLDQLVTPTR